MEGVTFLVAPSAQLSDTPFMKIHLLGANQATACGMNASYWLRTSHNVSDVTCKACLKTKQAKQPLVKWLLVCGLMALAACGAEEPTIQLIDPAGRMTQEELEAVVEAVAELAPEGRDAVLNRARFLRVFVDEGMGAHGTHQGGDIHVGWRTCADVNPRTHTYEIIAHEIGHAMGHERHEEAPAWFGVGGVQDQLYIAQCGAWQ